MKKISFVIIMLAMLVLAGCESAFKLPAGCEEDSAVGSGSDLQNSTASGEHIPVVDGSAAGSDLKDSAVVSSDAIPVKTVLEGAFVSFPNLKARDPDGDKLTYYFSEPLDSNGRWQTKIGDAGEYFAVITASDGKSRASQKVKIVVTAKNRPPVIEPIDDVVVSEGDVIRLSPVVSDAEGDEIVLSYSGWMDSDTKATDFGDSGKYLVVVKASDGRNSVIRGVNVIVRKINRAPVLEAVADVVIKEGDKITVKPVAADLDNDKITFRFSAPLDKTGVWQTKTGDYGTFNLTITASDGDLADTASFRVTVEPVNRPPVLTLRQVEINVDEGDIVTINSETTDVENDPVRVSYSGWMTGNSYKTDFDDNGVHTITVTATDGINTVSKDVLVTVRNVNRAPVFDAGSFD